MKWRQMYKMTETKLIEDKQLREQMASRVEVLDKVKKLFLIPDMEVMTTKMVADYYEVEIKTIQTAYQRNKNEIDNDGVKILKVSDFNEVYKMSNSLNNIIKTQNNISFTIADNIKVIVPNCGIKGFSKRAVLRCGMLLRDSAVAKEVRTQLLNIFEHSNDEQKIAEIDEELRLKTNIGIAYVNGDMDALTIANLEYNACELPTTLKGRGF